MKLIKIELVLGLLTLFQTNFAFTKDIALLTVATGKYSAFVKNLIQSARKHFLKNHNVTHYIFTDQILPIDGEDVKVIRCPHRPWPFSTLMRFDAYNQALEKIKADYFFACDADLMFVDKVGDEILGNSVAICHPGYYRRNLAPVLNDLTEKNPQSTAYITSIKGYKNYYAGGFYGGSSNYFKEIVSQCASNIAKDLENDLIAVWHDETHLNAYFIQHPPKVKLTPSYCYPQNARNYGNLNGIKPKIIALDKDHSGCRSGAPCLDDRDFVILIPSYNNINFYKKNLDSVYRQNYPSSKFRVIYADANSTDGTGDAVEKYVVECGKSAITTIIRNKQRLFPLENTYNAIQNYCYNNEVVLIVDGDDALAHPNVLSELNAIYKRNRVWFTYGNFWLVDSNSPCLWSYPVSQNQIAINSFRDITHGATHLRTFYTWLFKEINICDLKIENEFFKMAGDVAMLLPIWEMAGFNHKFIDKILYLYTESNQLSEHALDANLQANINQYVRKNLSKYKPIAGLEYFSVIFDLSEAQARELSYNKLVEASAILNDYIASVEYVYDSEDRHKLLSQIPLLQKKLTIDLGLLSIATHKDYSYLANYLKRLV